MIEEVSIRHVLIPTRHVLSHIHYFEEMTDITLRINDCDLPRSHKPVKQKSFITATIRHINY